MLSSEHGWLPYPYVYSSCGHPCVIKLARMGEGLTRAHPSFRSCGQLMANGVLQGVCVVDMGIVKDPKALDPLKTGKACPLGHLGSEVAKP